MKRTRWIAATLAVSATLMAPAIAKQKTVEVVLTAGVNISPEGRVTSIEWQNGREGLDTLAARLEPRVREWQFEPGAINGVPQATTTYLTIKLHGEETAETIKFRIGKVSTGAKIDQMPPPAYPVQAMRAGVSAYVVVNLSVTPEGKATVESLDYRSGPARFQAKFESAVRKAFDSTTYALERVGDRPVATRMQTTVEFCSYKGCPQHDAIKAEPSIAPPGQAVALESAVRLLDDVAGAARNL